MGSSVEDLFEVLVRYLDNFQDASIREESKKKMVEQADLGYLSNFSRLTLYSH